MCVVAADNLETQAAKAWEERAVYLDELDTLKAAMSTSSYKVMNVYS
jgi:hypothetical protein